MKSDSDMLLSVLRDPITVEWLSATTWSGLIRQARQCGLLARLADRLERQSLTERIPEGPRRHLDTARRMVANQRRQLHRELLELRQALSPVDTPVVLLKGAAYCAADLPPAGERLFSDIDILVPEARLTAVEQALYRQGWQSTHHDDYDQYYYRQWMHELPPMQHRRRQTWLDVHHNILPRTARVCPDAALLLAAAVDCPGYPGFRILAPVDMVLHSAAHLFYNSEMDNGLRDLLDLEQLLGHFSTDSMFWSQLLIRADQLKLQQVLYYALHCLDRLLAMPIPVAVLQQVEQAAPPAGQSWLIDRLFDRALMPEHTNSTMTVLARWLLYVRGHYLRMPLTLLIPHLIRKALRPGTGGA